MDLKALEKELRGTQTPFQKIIDIGDKKLIIQVNEKKEVYVLTDQDDYKFKSRKCTLTEKKLFNKRVQLSQILSGERLEKAMNEYIEENTITELKNIFPNIKQFILMLKGNLEK